MRRVNLLVNLVSLPTINNGYINYLDVGIIIDRVSTQSGDVRDIVHLSILNCCSLIVAVNGV